MPGENVTELVEQARSEVEQIRELIDEVLFLSRARVRLRASSRSARSPCRPELEAVADELEERARAQALRSVVEGDAAIELEIRPRMLRVVAQNLAENAIRYAGPGATFTLSVERDGDERRSCAARTTASASTRRSSAAAVRALLPRRPGARLARAPGSGSRS